MTKRRNKQNEGNKQKVLEAQHRNDFYNKLSKFCKDLTGEDILMLIPQADWKFLFDVRPMAITPEAGDSNVVDPGIIKGIKEVVTWWFKAHRITIGKNNQQVLMFDDFTFGIPLFSFIAGTEKIKKENLQKARDLLWDYFGDLNEIVSRLQIEFSKTLSRHLSILTNNFCLRYYSYSLELQESKGFRAVYKVIIKQYPIEKINVLLNHNTRPAYRIGWSFPNHSFEWTLLSQSDLGINRASTDKTIPVYIQMHALNRILERIDCFSQMDIQSFIIISLRNCKAIRENGNFLIEYKFLGVKLGYLQAVLTDGKLIIRTFLFLTCSGTPEGKRLEEIVGIQKLDAKYLKMDKLSTFMSAKISTNQEVRAIFEKADCLNLMELFEKLDNISNSHPENSPLEQIAEYLKDHNEEENRWMEEEGDNLKI